MPTVHTHPAPPKPPAVLLTGPDVPSEYEASSGPVRIRPTAVAMPGDPDELSGLVRWASQEGRSLVPRGAATGMPGHNVGPDVVVDLAGRMHRMGRVRTDDRTLRVDPGVTAARVAHAASEAGLYFPPLPSSADRCTIGGMISTNAAGARSFRYGSVREWVREIDVVFADGERATLGAGYPPPERLQALHRTLRPELGTAPPGWPRVRKNSSGYALDRFLPETNGLQLLAGSEGTLAFVTSAVLRLIPAPSARTVVLLGVPEVEVVPEVADAAEEMRASACEYVGRRLLEMGELYRDRELAELTEGRDALMLVEFEGDPADVTERVAEFRSRIRGPVACGLEARTPERRAALWDLRHRASPTIADAAKRGLRSTQFIEDGVVPRERLPAYVRGIRSILDDEATDAVIFGHAGDGNLHVNPLLDTRIPDLERRVRAILEATVELVAGLGGTLSGEHGDGRIRAPYLERVWGAELTNAFRRVKKCLDPAGILNPGVVVPRENQDALDGLVPLQAGPEATEGG